MCKAGNKVVFEQVDGKNASYIYNKNTGVEIPIDEVNNAYEFKMWVRRNQPVSRSTTLADFVTPTQWAALMESSESEEEVSTTFQRPVNQK